MSTTPKRAPVMPLADLPRTPASHLKKVGLAGMRRKFDERLAALDAPGAGKRLRAIVRGRAKLKGKVKVGTGY